MEIEKSDLECFLKLYEKKCEEIAREFDRSQKSRGQCFDELDDLANAILSSLEHIPIEFKSYLSEKFDMIERKLAGHYKLFRYSFIERRFKTFRRGF